MKKLSCILMVFIACITLSLASYGDNAVKDTLKKDIGLSDEVVKKLSNQEIVDIIKNKDELLHERKMAALKDDQPPVPILIVVFGSFVLMMFIPYYFNMKKTRSLHIMMNNLIEKGHEIPKDILFPAKKRTVRSDFHRGIILISLGLGLCIVLFLVKVPDNYWTIGFIPMLVGAGYLILHKFNNSAISKTENS